MTEHHSPIATGNFMERHPDLRELIAESGLTTETLDRAISLVRKTYLMLNDQLPEGHQWKQSKLAHADDCADEVEKHASLFGLQGTECAVFKFLLFGHDIGRLEQGRRRVRGEESLDADHGALSVAHIRGTLDATIDVSTPIWEAILCAIQHHSDRATPKPEEIGNPAAYALTILLRDMDKASLFKQKADLYTRSAEEKEHQRHANWPGRIAEDPEWGKELGLIDPSHLLETFLSGKTLNRPECRSWEAFMLLFLAFCFDFNIPEVLTMTLNHGGPGIVFSYLHQRLTIESQRSQSDVRDIARKQLERLEQWGKTWHGGILYRQMIANTP